MENKTLKHQTGKRFAPTDCKIIFFFKFLEFFFPVVTEREGSDV